jgi:SAM-dependent methyltransferase
MGRETSKANVRRRSEGYFDRIFVGRGIDIGFGDDAVTPDCVQWDKGEGDAQVLETLGSAEFDWVYSSHCLEHLLDPRTALRRWWEILKPGGYLMFVVPDEDLYEQEVWPSTFNPDHKWTFTVAKSSSWSPASLNVADLVAELPNRQVMWMRTCDTGYDYTGGRWDRTSGPAEAHIEVLLRKLGADS